MKQQQIYAKTLIDALSDAKQEGSAYIHVYNLVDEIESLEFHGYHDAVINLSPNDLDREVEIVDIHDSCYDIYLTGGNMTPNTERVNHPAHYQTASGLEVIDIIAAATENLTGVEAFCAGNAIKYICREGKKNGTEDLKKARWYLDWLIEHRTNGAVMPDYKKAVDAILERAQLSDLDGETEPED